MTIDDIERVKRDFVSAARDATVKLVNQTTGAAVERKPFLDGTLLVRDLDPGMYEVEVRHPNLTQAVARQKVRLFPQPRPTVITIGRVPGRGR